MEQWENTITLRGELAGMPERSHENHGKTFYRFFLEVERLSGAVDTLPVVAELGLLERIDLSAGSRIRVEGQVRSHNITDDTGRHLLIFVFATELVCEEGPCVNDLRIVGALCREPTYRRTPLGREICDAMLAVPRAFRRADYLPCILWGRLAQTVSECHTRDVISIDGRLQSRVYSKYADDQLIERTAYEVSALTAEIHSGSL